MVCSHNRISFDANVGTEAILHGKLALCRVERQAARSRDKRVPIVCVINDAGDVPMNREHSAKNKCRNMAGAAKVSVDVPNAFLDTFGASLIFEPAGYLVSPATGEFHREAFHVLHQP